MEIRAEQASDLHAIYLLNTAAFGQDAEPNLVDKLRELCRNFLSFLAVENGTVVGHILFTPVTLYGSDLVGMGLAPTKTGSEHGFS